MIKKLAWWILRKEIGNSTRLYSIAVVAARSARKEATENDELYFNGIQCVNGCGTTRLTSTGRCVKCTRVQRKKCYYNNQEHYIEKEAARKRIKAVKKRNMIVERGKSIARKKKIVRKKAKKLED